MSMETLIMQSHSDDDGFLERKEYCPVEPHGIPSQIPPHAPFPPSLIEPESVRSASVLRETNSTYISVPVA